MGKTTDHGDFTIQRPQENMILLHLSERAPMNHEKPGEAWGRLEAKRAREGRTEQGLKVFHLDQNARRPTITETWDGVETARQTTVIEEVLPVPCGIG